MRANPGGHIDPADAVGRNGLVAAIWHALGRQSVVLTSERRMGKTTTLGILQAQSPAGKVAVYLDLEQAANADEFARELYESVKGYLPRTERVVQGGRQAAHVISGSKVSEFTLPEIEEQHWKDRVGRTLRALADKKDTCVVLCFDELPYMLANISKSQGAATAEEILACLRSIRQECPAVRMIYTGSIGLHHVLSSLRTEGYHGAHTNDMFVVDCPPLDEDDAMDLARKLLDSEGIQTPSLAETARAIAIASDGIAFLIHHIVARMPVDRPVDGNTVEQVVQCLMRDPQDPLDLSHFVERVPVYYGTRKRTAYALLDAAAAAPDSAAFGDFLDAARRINPRVGREAVLVMVDLLMRDHYLVQDEGGRYRFRFPFIQRFWQFKRGLLS